MEETNIEIKKDNIELNELNELNELKDKNLRLLADIQNIKRRHSIELENRLKYKEFDLALSIVDTANEIYTAIQAHKTDDTIASGLKLIYTNLVNRLASFEIYPIQIKVNETKFDDNIHEAINYIVTDDPKLEHIIAATNSINTGWTYKDKILKYPKVSVYLYKKENN